MKAYKKLMGGITKVEIVILCVISVVVTAITFANVLSRFVFHASFSWSEELVINVFILMIMLGVGLCHQDGGMITLSLVFDNVGIKGRKIMVVIDTIVNLAFYVLIIKTGFDKVASQIATGKETFSLGWPEWIFTIRAVRLPASRNWRAKHNDQSDFVRQLLCHAASEYSHCGQPGHVRHLRAAG